eukprot:6210517-Pleurochrysis_carterae.AAC.1
MHARQSGRVAVSASLCEVLALVPPLARALLRWRSLSGGAGDAERGERGERAAARRSSQNASAGAAGVDTIVGTWAESSWLIVWAAEYA